LKPYEKLAMFGRFQALREVRVAKERGMLAIIDVNCMYSK
jgi:hypothetical protein